jgi:hypothetical protein
LRIIGVGFVKLLLVEIEVFSSNLVRFWWSLSRGGR